MSGVSIFRALQMARARIADMLEADDGQAWKEAEKALPIIDSALATGAGLAKLTFLTCVSGDGPSPYLKIHFANLAEAHAAHIELLALTGESNHAR